MRVFFNNLRSAGRRLRRNLRVGRSTTSRPKESTRTQGLAPIHAVIQYASMPLDFFDPRVVLFTYDDRNGSRPSEPGPVCVPAGPSWFATDRRQ